MLPKISALATEVGGLASHIATLSREYRVPTIMGLPGLSRLAPQTPITVDATDAKIYAGEHPAIVRARCMTTRSTFCPALYVNEWVGAMTSVLDVQTPTFLTWQDKNTYTRIQVVYH